MKRAAAASLALASLLFAGEQKRKTPPAPDVEVVEVTARRVERWVHLDGVVKNVSDRPIEGLVLLFDFMATARQVVTTKNGAIAEEFLEPGQECSFHFQMADPVRAVRFRVRATAAKGREPSVANSGPFPIE